MTVKSLHADVYDKGLEQISNSANWGGGVLTMALCVGAPANVTEASTLYPTGKRISSAISMAGIDLVLADKAGGGREVTVAAKAGVVEAMVNTLVDSGTAELGGVATLTDTDKTWVVDSLIGKTLKPVSGTGAGQASVITSNTATTATVENNWATQPDATTGYEVRQNMTLVIYDGGGAPRLLLVTDETNDQTMDVLNNPINVPSFTFGLAAPV